MKLKNTSNALWLSRHEPTKEQLTEIEELAYQIVDLEHGKKLGSYEINDQQDLKFFESELEKFIVENDIEAIFGVFSTPILHYIYIQSHLNINHPAYSEKGVLEIPCFAAWNKKRTREGQPPTFEHYTFARIGDLIVVV